MLFVDGEAKSSREHLNHGRLGRLVLGELLTGVEAEDGDVQSVAAVNDLGDDCTGLDGDFACRIGDQCVRHHAIMVRASPAACIGARSDNSSEQGVGLEMGSPVLIDLMTNGSGAAPRG